MNLGIKKPLTYLLLSSLLGTVAGLMRTGSGNPVLVGGISFVNAVGMALIAAVAGYGVMVTVVGKKVTLARFVSIYALCHSATLLVSWVPFFIWFSEPWKWWLIGTGMTRGFGFSRLQAIIIIGISLGVIILFFWSLGPVVASQT